MVVLVPLGQETLRAAPAGRGPVEEPVLPRVAEPESAPRTGVLPPCPPASGLLLFEPSGPDPEPASLPSSPKSAAWCPPHAPISAERRATGAPMTSQTFIRLLLHGLRSHAESNAARASLVE